MEQLRNRVFMEGIKLLFPRIKLTCFFFEFLGFLGVFIKLCILFVYQASQKHMRVI